MMSAFARWVQRAKALPQFRKSRINPIHLAARSVALIWNIANHYNYLGLR